MISVIVIGKNEGERLAACLKSIQTALNALAHEVVYVDSCSTDQSLQTAKALGARCFLLAERKTTAGLGRISAVSGWRHAASARFRGKGADGHCRQGL